MTAFVSLLSVRVPSARVSVFRPLLAALVVAAVSFGSASYAVAQTTWYATDRGRGVYANALAAYAVNSRGVMVGSGMTGGGASFGF